MQQLRGSSCKLHSRQQAPSVKFTVHSAPCFHAAAASSAAAPKNRQHALIVRAETGSSTRTSATTAGTSVLEAPRPQPQGVSGVTGATVVAAPLSPPGLKRARVVEDLKDPLQIGASGAASHKLDAFPGDVSLTRYMELPVEQYFVLDPKQIQFLGGDRFLLIVPRINILNVWVEPLVEVSVTFRRGPNPSVLLKAENARIRGSELIENLKLDQRFVLQFQTELTWSTDTSGGSGSSLSSGNDSSLGGSLDGFGSSSNSYAVPVVSSAASSSAAVVPAGKLKPVGKGVINGTARLDVWSEVVQPFNIMPRQALQGTCNLVLRGLVGSLLPLFVRKLSEDYMKWAQDPAYRAERALRSAPLQ